MDIPVFHLGIRVKQLEQKLDYDPYLQMRYEAILNLTASASCSVNGS